MRLRPSLVSLGVLALVLSAPAHATFTVYTTQAGYLAAISSPGVDTFNDLNPNLSMPTPQNRSAGAYTYTTSVGPNSIFFPAGTLGGDAWLATDNRLDTITFSNFTSTVRGVGAFFFRSDVSGALTSTAATLTVRATDASGTNTQTLVNPGLTTFLGFVSDGPITNLQVFVGTQGTGTAGVWPTVNDLTLGLAAAVPEPGTYALMLGGLALTAAAARRRRQQG